MNCYTESKKSKNAASIQYSFLTIKGVDIMKKIYVPILLSILACIMYGCGKGNSESESISVDENKIIVTEQPTLKGIDNKVFESDGIIEPMDSDELETKLSALYKDQTLDEIIKLFGKEPFYVKETNENVFEYYSGEITIRLWGLPLFQACVEDKNGIRMIPLYHNPLAELVEFDIPESQKGRNIEELKALYPDLFEIIGAPIGIDVYVWQMAENSYSCGLRFTRNSSITDDDLIELNNKAVSIEEAKLILNEIGLEKESIIVFPVRQQFSSYYYEIDDAYIERIDKMFEGKCTIGIRTVRKADHT